MKAEERSLPFLILLKRARNTLTGSWVCSVFSPKKAVKKPLPFLFPVCEFVCTQLLAAACTTAPPCLLPLLLALGWPLILLSSSSSNTALPQRFSLSMLGSFSKVPYLLWLDDFTALFLLFLTLHACSSLTAQLLFASFIFYPCTAEPRTQLCFTELGLGTGSWPWSPGSATGPGEKTRVAQSSSSPRSVLGWHQPGRWQCRDLLFHLASLILTLSDVWSVSENSGFFRKKKQTPKL